MSQERPIEDWLGELPEPERTEALEARRKAVERGGYHASKKTAESHSDALFNGFHWQKDAGDVPEWDAIHRRALAGEFDRPVEVERLRARIAELEGALSKLYSAIDSAIELTPELLQETSAILNNK